MWNHEKWRTYCETVRKAVKPCYTQWNHESWEIWFIPLEIIRNVLEGSILGPISFNLYINDPVFHQENKVCNFAHATIYQYSCSLSYEEAHQNYLTTHILFQTGFELIVWLRKLTFTKHIHNLCNTAGKTFELWQE